MSRSARGFLATFVMALALILGGAAAASATTTHGYDATLEPSATERSWGGATEATPQLSRLTDSGSTDPIAAGFTYDKRPVARVEAQEANVVLAASSLVNDVRARFVMHSVVPRRTSMTPDSAVIATKLGDLHGPHPIDAGKQSRHIAGSQRHTQRVADGKPSSTFIDPAEADTLVQEAWHLGTPNPRNLAERTFDFNRPVGDGGFGGTQSRITAVLGGNGRLHGFPSGRAVF